MQTRHWFWPVANWPHQYWILRTSCQWTSRNNWTWYKATKTLKLIYKEAPLKATLRFMDQESLVMFRCSNRGSNTSCPCITDFPKFSTYWWYQLAQRKDFFAQSYECIIHYLNRILNIEHKTLLVFSVSPCSGIGLRVDALEQNIIRYFFLKFCSWSPTAYLSIEAKLFNDHYVQ